MTVDNDNDVQPAETPTPKPRGRRSTKSDPVGSHRGTVTSVAEVDVRLAQVRTAARRWYQAAQLAEAASAELTERLREADALNQRFPRAVSDQVLATAVNDGIPASAKAEGRPMRMGLMTVRRRLGKAPQKSWKATKAKRAGAKNSP